MRLKNRRILITGAASGIGYATALLFKHEGASLALVDQNREALEAKAAELGAIAIVADLRNEDEVKGAVDQAGASLKGIDGIINAAGIFIPGSLADTNTSSWRNVIDVNLTGPFLVSKFALPWLQAEERATIVNIASGQALLPSTGSASYGASKAGVAMLSKFMAQELAPKIRVNAIAPGIVDTAMTKAHFESLDSTQLSAALQAYAMKRVGEASEIADLLLFLTGQESSYITGTLIAVDGGRSYH